MRKWDRLRWYDGGVGAWKAERKGGWVRFYPWGWWVGYHFHLSCYMHAMYLLDCLLCVGHCTSVLFVNEKVFLMPLAVLPKPASNAFQLDPLIEQVSFLWVPVRIQFARAKIARFVSQQSWKLRHRVCHHGWTPNPTELLCSSMMSQ